jgi:hypothetical protein
MKATDKRIANLEETVVELATAIESIVAAILIAERDPETSRRLLADAGALSAAIRSATESPTPPEHHDA